MVVDEIATRLSDSISTAAVKSLNEHLWGAAALLATARLKSNDGRRATNRDRQSEGPVVDLMGAASDLLLYRDLLDLARQIKAGSTPQRDTQLEVVAASLQHMQNTLYFAEGGGRADGADLVLAEGDLARCFDAKSFDFAPRKRYFAINDKKHEALRSLRPMYSCMLSVPFAKKALRCVVSYEEVDAWERRQLGSRQPPDPARVMPIETFLKKHFGQQLTVCRETVSARHSAGDLARSTSIGGIARDGLKCRVPALGEMLESTSADFESLLNEILQL